MLTLTVAASAQMDEFCFAAGYKPSLDPPFPPVPYIYGIVRVKVPSSCPKPQQIVLTYSDRMQPLTRQVIGSSGTYCFKRNAGSGATMIVEVDGKEIVRRNVPSVGAAQQREDFEVELQETSPESAPGVVSTKFSRDPNEKTVELYKKLAKSERSEDIEMEIFYLKKIVSADPEDYPAWGKLGARYFEKQSFPEAEDAFKRAIKLNAEYTPALLGTGMIRIQEKHFDAAIDVFKQVTVMDPTSGMAYKLLGQSYLWNRNGKLGLEALDQALKVDPIGMAECHLIKGNLFELNGAKQLATAEYKAFLTKVPDYKEKKRLEKFIANNPN
jgi:tetratricopeptide (TPR) repeat protein